ncbi:hypothetical protein TTHERM_00576880 (macronuclear) [Tetrahymena thermophila SB210]|uniref:Kinase domain protein n=1 Tax=Tetrahymena thermophila (strain SB210) TaxID=312017 RepID=Q22V15_TETTS|nr:hypothetical protein TTHERM_00576880 [Tetrahymena thermophila SB210]EAR89133.2 hypothetical protein TTHERM_00576880 [Tetrahymena thermophila SB210]|eukprot:XP_001009378.2 hypothetical protein TTHERM_00576880 [Tetrahymena thermophila SB210]
MQTYQLVQSMLDIGFDTYISFLNERMKIILRRMEIRQIQITENIESRYLLPQIQYLSVEIERDIVYSLDRLAQFFASIPQNSDLKQLQITIHEGNEIYDEGCQIITNFIASNSKTLNSLDLKIEQILDYNMIDEEGGIHLGQCLLQLTNLEKLILEIGKNVNIQGNVAAKLLQGLKHLSLNYFKLRLFPKEIDDQGFVDMQNELTQIKSLQTLDLSIILYGDNAGIYANGFKYLGMNLPQLDNLKVLDFQFYGPPISIVQSNNLVSQIYKLKYLEQFKMDIQPLASSQVQIDSFLQSLSKCQKLNKLHITLPSFIFSISSHQFEEEIQIPFQNLLDFEFKFENVSLSEEASNAIGQQISKMIKLENLKIQLRNNGDSVDSTVKNIMKGVEYCSYLKNFFFEIGSKNKVQSEGVRCLIGSLQNKQCLNNLMIKFEIGNKIESKSLDNFQEVSKTLSSLQALTLEIKESNLKSQDIVVLKNSLRNLQVLKEFNIIFNRNLGLQNENEIEERDKITQNFGELIGAIKSIEVLKFYFVQYQKLSQLNQNHIFNGLGSGLFNLKVLHIMLANQIELNSESFQLLQNALSKCNSLIELELKLQSLRHNQDQNEIRLYNILNSCNNLIKFSYEVYTSGFLIYNLGQEMKRLKKNAMRKKKIIVLNKL